MPRGNVVPGSLRSWKGRPAQLGAGALPDRAFPVGGHPCPERAPPPFLSVGSIPTAGEATGDEGSIGGIDIAALQPRCTCAQEPVNSTARYSSSLCTQGASTMAASEGVYSGEQVRGCELSPHH
jgi:hypothetical protein